MTDHWKSTDGVRRRDVLKRLAVAAPLLWAAPGCLTVRPSRSRAHADELVADELVADLVIIGGGLGGCAAALAAARRGLRV